MPPRLGGTLFEAAWRLRGFQEFLCELSQGHEVSLWLLDRLADLTCHYARMIAAADADVLFVGDDVGEPVRLMISPALWRHAVGPRMRRIVEAARAVKPGMHVCYHDRINRKEAQGTQEKKQRQQHTLKSGRTARNY